MIPYWMYLIGVYLAVGCGHAYTLYEMANLLAEQTDNDELAMEPLEAFIAIFVWPLFMICMMFEPRVEKDDE